MRSRMSLLLVAIAVLACFAALNWSEFVRPTQLSWGFGVGEAPLGLILLGVLAISWVAFLMGSAYLETHYKLAAHRNAKALEAQRVLADKAEGSRFTELRTYLEGQASLAAQREVATVARLEHAVHRDLIDVRAALNHLDGKLSGYVAGTVVPPEVVLRHDGRSPH